MEPVMKVLLLIFVTVASGATILGFGDKPEPDCNGHNGNAAIVACHPGIRAIEVACPDNSNGKPYAAPDEYCLDAARPYS
jgi:hypothetical protein